MYGAEEIKTFIPQREPFMMVDKLFSASDDSVETGLTVREENLFVSGGEFAETGLIEHIAQSAACFAGYNDWKNNRPVVLGYIAEIKNFSLENTVKTGDELFSTLKVLSNVMNITMMEAVTVKKDGQRAASCRIKIFMDRKK